VSPLPGLATPNGGPDDPLPWCRSGHALVLQLAVSPWRCAQRGAAGGDRIKSVEQLEAQCHPCPTQRHRMEDPTTLCPSIRAGGPGVAARAPPPPGGAPGVKQLEATESEGWSSWRRSVTPAQLGGTEWRSRRPSALASERLSLGAAARGRPMAARPAWSSWR
jgi:hypothetical protein